MTTPLSGGGSKRFTELGRLLRSRREELGLSRQKLAGLTELSYPYIAQLEGGHRAPSAEAARQLADALELSQGVVAEVLAREKGISRAGGTSGFLQNPGFAPADVGSPAVVPHASSLGGGPRALQDVDEFVDEVASLFERLPVDRRLDALGRLQGRVMTSVVADQVRRANDAVPQD